MFGHKYYAVRKINPELPFTAYDLKDERAPYVFTGFDGSLAWGTLPMAWNDTEIDRIQVNIEPFLAKVAERGGILLEFLPLEGIEVDAGLKPNLNSGRYPFNPGLAGIANLIRFYGEQK
jgi:hypothetical protein